MAFADHFSRQSEDYTRFRPHYPRELFAHLATLPAQRQLAWDCGTGNGQAAVDLANDFERVIATDPSSNQLEHAAQHPRVEYRISPAEKVPIESHSVDLVTVAQALHWFDFERFYAEVRRVARAGSAIAAWCYGLGSISPEVDRVVHYLYEDVLGAYWPPEHKAIEDDYRSLPFPFDEIALPKFEMTAAWTLDDLLGYLGTWSSTQQYVERHGSNPVALIALELAKAWGTPGAARLVRWPFHAQAGRIEPA